MKARTPLLAAALALHAALLIAVMRLIGDDSDWLVLLPVVALPPWLAGLLTARELREPIALAWRRHRPVLAGTERELADQLVSGMRPVETLTAHLLLAVPMIGLWVCLAWPIFATGSRPLIGSWILAGPVLFHFAALVLASTVLRLITGLPHPRLVQTALRHAGFLAILAGYVVGGLAVSTWAGSELGVSGVYGLKGAVGILAMVLVAWSLVFAGAGFVLHRLFGR